MPSKRMWREANRLLREINRLNIRISNTKAQRQDSSIAENQRDTALHKLSGILNVQTSTNKTGRVSVYTRTGHLLVGQSEPRLLEYEISAKRIGIVGVDSALASNVSNQLPKGSLRAHFQIIRDGDQNTTDIHENNALLAKYEIILDELVTNFTDIAGGTNTFNEAFSRSIPTIAPAPPTTFFTTGATINRFSIAVEANIRNRTIAIPKETVQTTVTADNIIAVLNLETRNINNVNLTVSLQQTDKSYQDLTNGIITLAGNTIRINEEFSLVDVGVRDSLREDLVNRVGVNADQELTYIQQLQTMYAANARILDTVSKMLQELIASV